MENHSFKRTAKDLNNSVASTPMKPSPKVLKVNDEEESKLGKILEEIAQMNRKLDKLETIEEHLTRVDNDIKELKESYTFGSFSFSLISKSLPTYFSDLCIENTQVHG